MTIVYRAHEVATDEVIENSSVSVLVQFLATNRPHNTLEDYKLYSANEGDKFNHNSPLSPSLMDAVRTIYDLIKTNIGLKRRIRDIQPEPEYFKSEVTMVVRVAVDGLNMINQPYNPEYLLELACSTESNGVYINNLTVDMEEATDQFGDEVIEEYIYEYSELSDLQREILGMGDFNEDLDLDLDQFTAPNPPVMSGGIPTRPGKITGKAPRPKPLQPKQL